MGKLVKEMEREQAELLARRKAQAEWNFNLSHETERRKQEAERIARERDYIQSRADEEWRRRWWGTWQQHDENTRRKVDEQKEWSKQWWEQWKEKPQDDDEDLGEEEPQRTHRGPIPGPSAKRTREMPQPKSTWTAPPIPPPPKAAMNVASVQQAQVLEQLVVYRRESLEERKRIWRQL